MGERVGVMIFLKKIRNRDSDLDHISSTFEHFPTSKTFQATLGDNHGNCVASAHLVTVIF